MQLDQFGNPIYDGSGWASSPPGTPPPWLTPTVGGIPAPIIDQAANAPVAQATPVPSTPEDYSRLANPNGSIADTPWADHSMDPGGSADVGPVKIDPAAGQPATAPPGTGGLGSAAPEAAPPWVQAPTVGTETPSQVLADDEKAAQADDEATRKEGERIAAMSPEQVAELDSLNQFRKQREESRRAALNSHANLIATQQNLDDHLKAVAAIQADSARIDEQAKQIANQRTDPNHWRSSRTTGQSIANFVAAVAGGMNSVNTGGRNLGLDYIDKQIDQDVKAQTENLANQWKGIGEAKDSLGRQVATNADLYRVRETLRQANYEDVKNQLTAEMLQYNPRGTTAIAIAKQIQDIRARQAALKQAVDEKMLKDRLDIMKEDRERTVANATIAHQQGELSLGWANHATEASKAATEAAKNAAENHVYTRDELAILHPGMAIPPVDKMTAKQYDEWLGTEAKGQAAVKTSNEIAAQEAGSQVRNPVTGQVLTKIDPTTKQAVPIKLGTAEAKEVNEYTKSSQNLVDALSEARRFLASDPSAFSRKEWAAEQTKIENAKAAFIELHKAKLSSREMAAVHDMFGSNFEDLRDRITDKGKSLARIDALLNIAHRETGTTLLSMTGYAGPSVLLDTAKPTASAPTSVDAATEAIADSEKHPTFASPDDKQYRELGHPGEAIAMTGGSAADYAGRTDSPLVVRALQLGIAPTKLKAFDALETMIKSDKPEDETQKLQAYAALNEVAADGNSKALKEYAKARLKALADETANVTPLEPTNVPAGVRDNNAVPGSALR